MTGGFLVTVFEAEIKVNITVCSMLFLKEFDVVANKLLGGALHAEFRLRPTLVTYSATMQIEKVCRHEWLCRSWWSPMVCQ